VFALKIVVLQGGPVSCDINANLEACGYLIDNAAKHNPDIILLSELALTPTFAFSQKETYFDWSEPLDGRSVSFLAKKAQKYKINIIFPFFEKGKLGGTYYNSAVVINRKGEIINGTLPNGEFVDCYRKTHIPTLIYHLEGRDIPYNECFYFKPGPGLPVFNVDDTTIGILICADRAMPEAWRVLALQKAKIIFLPAAIPSWKSGPGGIKREELFVAELRVRALENGLFIAAANKGGEEELDGISKSFFGGSCIIDPYGQILDQAPFQKGPVQISSEIRLEEVSVARKRLPLFMLRRPELYGLIVK